MAEIHLVCQCDKGHRWPRILEETYLTGIGPCPECQSGTVYAGVAPMESEFQELLRRWREQHG